MTRAGKLIAATSVVAALAPAAPALAQSAPSSGTGIAPGRIEFTQTTVKVTGSNAVPRFERTRQYLTAHDSHTTTRTIATGKIRFEGVTTPRRELRYDAETNTITVAKGTRKPPYQTVEQEARTFAQQVANGCWTATGDTVFEGRSATSYKLVPATSGPCRGDAQVGQAIVDKATGAILEREAGEADGSFKQVEVLERFGTMALNRRTKPLLAFGSHRGAKRVVEGTSTRHGGRR
jgi:hypothetical protein